MRAAVYYANNDLRVSDVESPKPAAGEVKIRVAYAGICGSDLHEVHEGPQTCCAAGGPPHALTGTTLPMTLGHEFSGTIAELGEGVVEPLLKVGTKVCVEPVISCRTCAFCRSGDRPLCEKGIGFFGYNRPGGLAPFVNVSKENVHVVPESISIKEAALVEPLSVAWHAVRQSGLKQGDRALVIGSGPIGALVTRVLKAQGAQWVGVSEPTKVRSEIAHKCGADAVYNPMQDDVVAKVKEATGGLGVDVAIDCAGNQRTLDAAIAACRKRGKIVMVALWSKPAQVDMQQLVMTEKSITASCCFNSQDTIEVLDALDTKRIRVEDLVTGVIDLGDIMPKGIDALTNEQHHIKILVDLTKEKV